MSIYYIYAYLRDDRTPYYIGKGKGNRAWKKGKGEIYPPMDKSNIVLCKKFLNENEALNLEKRLIKWFGRKDKGTGILRNKTDGGDGVGSGRIPSDYERKYKRQLILGEKNPMKRPEVAEKISKANRGKIPWNKGKKIAPLSEEQKKKISESMKIARAEKNWSTKKR